MESLRNLSELYEAFAGTVVFRLGASELRLGTLLYVAVLVVLLFGVTARLRRWVVYRLLARSSVELGVREATGSIVRYLFITVGLLVIVQTAGIDLTTLNVVAGAVGIGVGFGLQNIANNFISGLIILFERPIKIGDRIQVGDVEGDVVEINVRSTTVVTNDNISIIIPNSKLIDENVVNWSHNDRKIRFRIAVSVAYGTDVRLVERLLLEVAADNPDVLEDPPPSVRFIEFGDSGLHLELRAWSTTLLHRKGLLVSSLNFVIYDKLREHRIEIPFPQRDLHIRGGSLEIRRAREDAASDPDV